MISREIRRNFLNYFKNKGHRIVPSSPVIPHDDPTLLFINAGMNQFKDVFLGKSKRDYSRAVTTQKCIRVGGKHNDLENVGHTARHLTFFEMLGNFSFGDYFKKEAIDFAWDVTLNVFRYDPEFLWATVFETDEEAFELWKAYLPEKRIIWRGEKDNFWTMGDTGPCGPCSELLYDRGDLFGDAARPEEDILEERFLEFWNLVFIEFDRSSSGTLTPLLQKSVDTGGGLERIAEIKIGAGSIFETDVLRTLITVIEEISGLQYEPSDKKLAPAFHVIADHIRCLSFAIADGVMPSNVERGYVLRKVLRRAVRYGRMLGITKPFLAQSLPCLVKLMGEDFPELKTAEKQIEEIITQEEEGFLRTLKRGGNLLNQVIEDSEEQGIISGDDAFTLKDTYGLPIEEVLLIAKDNDLSVDKKRYLELEKQAKDRSRKARKVTTQKVADSFYETYIATFGPCKFEGYEKLSTEALVNTLFADNEEVSSLSEGQKGTVILDKTPFYAEKGGQIGDQGMLYGKNFCFNVEDTQSPYPGVIVHFGHVKKGKIAVEELISAEVLSQRRLKIANNHTATHLLHYALRTILGEHVKQAGSVVEPLRLRFDFSYHKQLTQAEIEQIENLVNQMIRQNIPVKNFELSYQEASEKKEILQFFGEKYGDTVRVVDVEDSKELCGGTHTHATGTIGYFRIIKEGSIAAGTRRIEAVSGEEAEEFTRKTVNNLQEDHETLAAQKRKLEEQLKQARKKLLIQEAENLLEHLKKIDEIPYLAHIVPLSSQEMKELADLIMQKEPSLVLFLATKEGGRCSLLARISSDLIAKGFKANDLIQKTASIISGRGGGKADAAQGGGSDSQNLDKAISQVRAWIKSS